MYRKCDGGGVEALWEFEGAYGCFANCELGREGGVRVSDGISGTVVIYVCKRFG